MNLFNAMMGKEKMLEMIKEAVTLQTGEKFNTCKMMVDVPKKKIFIITESGNKFDTDNVSLGISLFEKKIKADLRKQKEEIKEIRAFNIDFDFIKNIVSADVFFINNAGEKKQQNVTY